MLSICLLFFVLASPIIALIASARATRVERRLQETADDLHRQIDLLAARLAVLQGTQPAAAPNPVPHAVADAAAAPTPPVKPVAVVPAAETMPARTVDPWTAFAPPGPAHRDVEPAASPLEPPSLPHDELPDEPAAPPFWRTIDWEGMVGVKLFSAVAGIALALAGVFFLRFSIDHGWLQPPVRAALGILTSTTLLALCEQRFARRYRLTANALDAGSLAILFATFFAAHTLWNLIGTLTAFFLLGLVTALAVHLSVRRDSLFIAVLGLLGGFATPALLGSGHDNPIGLFGYLLLLNAGLSWIAYLKRWPVLTALSLALTFGYQWAWVFRFLTVQKLPLAAGIFLVFPILSFGAFVLGRQLPGARAARRGRLAGDDADADAPTPEQTGESAEGGEDGDEEPDGLGASVPWLMRFGPTTGISAALPLLLATYVAAVPEFGTQYWLLFGFLFCLAAGLFAIAMLRGFYILHVIGALSSVTVTLVWLGMSYQPEAWPGVLVILALFILFYLAAPLIATRLGRDLQEPASRAHLASALFFAFFAALARLEPGRDALPLLFGTLFVLLAITGAYAMRRGAGIVYYVAAFFGVAAQAAWSARYLTPERLVPALLLYASFGLLYLGIPEAARRLKRPLQPEGAGAWLLLASLALLFFLAEPGVAPASLWGIGVLLAVLNAGLFVESLAVRERWLAMVGIGLSWLVLCTWWVTVPLAPIVLPAVTVLVAYALLVFAGMHWMVLRAAGMADPPDEFESTYAPGLAFVAYGFLAHLAIAVDLATPAWLILAALAVLAAAAVFAALRTRRGALHLTATVFAGIVLLLWTSSAAPAAVAAPWTLLAMGAVLALLACAAGTYAAAERRGMSGEGTFAAAVVGAAFLGQAALICVFGSPSGRGLVWLVSPPHILCVAAILSVAWRRGWAVLPIGSVAMSAVALTIALLPRGSAHMSMWHFWAAAAIHACYLAYPVLLGRRAGCAWPPYLAAALASGMFFFVGRVDLIDAGYRALVPLLPVVQALIMGGLVMLLLRIEPPGSRSLGRLALTAGAALAFVTVAMPLQFEREWLTLGWALEAAALAWLYRRVPHRGLLLATAMLAAVVFGRLVGNPDVFMYSPRSDRPILNWYLYTYLVASAAFFAAARLLHATADRLTDRPWMPRVSALLEGGGTILLFALLNIEIADFFSTGPTLAFHFSATLGQDLTYTLGWLLFGVALLGAGIVVSNQPARIAALGLLVVTILKCFLHDLGRLGGLYRVGAFVGLAICLTLVAVALQRFVLTGPQTAAAAADGASPE